MYDDWMLAFISFVMFLVISKSRLYFKVSEWGEWSECARSCEGGVKYRNRTVIVDVLCGGVSCPNLTVCLKYVVSV